MLEQLASARRIVEDGHEVVPAWRIATPEGSFIVLTRFDTDKPEQGDSVRFGQLAMLPGGPQASGRRASNGL